MNLKNALNALSVGRETAAPRSLTTPWSRQVTPENAWREYPRPQLVRESYINLNGLWDCAVTERHALLYRGQILVPFSPEAPLSGVGRQLLPGQVLHYSRRFPLSQKPAGKRLLLHFGAVDERCRVCVNGREAGRHRGGYLPFSFDITELVRAGENTLSVSCRDDSDTSFHSRGKQRLKRGGIFYTAQSGIWQTVWMEWVPEVYIESIRLTPDYDREEVQIHLDIHDPAASLPAAHDSGGPRHPSGETAPFAFRIKAQVSSQGRTVAQFSTESTDFQMVLHNFTPWTPDNPFLYDLELRLFTAGDEEGDRVSSYFAMRCFSVERDAEGIARLCLNHVPYFQNGVLDQGYWPDGLYTAPCDEALISDIRRMKEAGFNMLRKHCKLEPLRWYYHCDRLGMLVWQDMVNGGSSYDMTRICYLPTVLPSCGARPGERRRAAGRMNPEGREEWFRETQASIDHLYSCPCIAGWVLFNEGWGQFDTARATDFARALDPTRFIDQASGWFDHQGGDMRSVHNYFRPLTCPETNTESQAVAKPLSANRCGLRAAVISEYGGLALPVPGHTASQAVFGYRSLKSAAEFRERFAALQEQIQKLQKSGLSAAVYTQVSDIEDEMNGILTYDRRVNKLSFH